MRIKFPLLLLFILTSLFCTLSGSLLTTHSQDRVPRTPPAAGNYHALVIGNNAYLKFRRLKTAEDDARAVESVLREQYGFHTRLL